jgi:hypothetical protein
VKTTLRWEPPRTAGEEELKGIMGPVAELELVHEEVFGVLQPVFALGYRTSGFSWSRASQYKSSPYLVHPGGRVSFDEAAGLR